MKKMGLVAAVLFGFNIAAPALNVTPGSGGTAISADTAVNGGAPAWTTIGPITLSENKNGHRSHFRAGTNLTLGLQAPAGFQFNTALIPNVEFLADRDVTAASAEFTRSNLLTVTFTVKGTGNRDTVMIGTTAGLQVQPLSSAPLVSGNIHRPKGAAGGTAVIKGVTPTSNLNGVGGGATSFGRLVQVAGSPTKLGILTQPSQNAVAGTPFGRQPVVAIQDASGNVRTNISGMTVVAIRSDGVGNLLGQVAMATVNGTATFTNLAADTASTISITFMAGELQAVTSSLINVAPAPEPPMASSLGIKFQPSSQNVAGALFTQQPQVVVLDQYDLPFTNTAGIVVSAARKSGSGELQGATNLEAVDGVAIFTNLSHHVAGDMTVEFTAGSLQPIVSEWITIQPAIADRLAFETQPGAAVFGVPFGIQPAVITTDAFGNFSTVGLGDSVPMEIALLMGTGTLTGTVDGNLGVAEENGVSIFNDLAIDLAGEKQLIATATGLASATSAVFTVASATQTIDFGPLAEKTFGDAPFTVSAAASSGLPVAFSVVSGPATLSNDLVTIVGVGTITIRASQSGNENYNAAADVEQSFVVAKSGQTISFGPLEGKTFGDSPFAVTATASSGLPVSFSIVSGPAVFVTPDTISINGAGTIVVRASQSGNENYNAAELDQSFAVNKAGQTITFDSLPGKQLGETPFEITAASSSGLPVSFSVVSGPATISENIVTLTGAGEVTIRASQAGNENYNAATDVDQVLTVNAPSDIRVKSDLNGDLKADVFFQSGTRVTVWQMNGLQFDRAVTVNKAYGTTDWKAFGQADFNKDGKQDIAWQHADGRLAVWYMEGRQRNGIGSIRPIAPEWKAVAVCDMNNDGSADLIFQNATGAVVIRYLNGIKIAGNKRVNRADAAQWRVCGAGDIDLDSSADLIVQHTGGQVALWKGTGYKQTVSINGGKPTDWSVCGIGDMNQDDKFDIVLRSADGRLGVWTMNGAEKLPGRTVLRNGRRVLSASVAGPR